MLFCLGNYICLNNSLRQEICRIHINTNLQKNWYGKHDGMLLFTFDQKRLWKISMEFQFPFQNVSKPVWHYRFLKQVIQLHAVSYLYVTCLLFESSLWKTKFMTYKDVYSAEKGWSNLRHLMKTVANSITVITRRIFDSFVLVSINSSFPLFWEGTINMTS